MAATREAMFYLPDAVRELHVREAMEALAERAGVDLRKQEYTAAQRQEADRRARLLEINKEAAKYFFVLLRGERGKRALDYFKKRALSDETIHKFGLGYSDQYRR